MILDLYRKRLPDYSICAAEAREIAALTEIVSNYALIHCDTVNDYDKAALAFSAVSDKIQELSAALDILDNFTDPREFGYIQPEYATCQSKA